jgi:predicted CoA-binding protein
MGTVVVLGASPNPERYAYKAVTFLLHRHYPVVAIGNRKGQIGSVPIITGKPEIPDVHTVLIYIGPSNQGEIVDYVISLHPRRVIFNPGTESPEFEQLLESYNIQVVRACSLVLIGTGKF